MSHDTNASFADMRLAASPEQIRLCFVVETTTDIRLVEGFDSRYQLTTLVRRFAAKSALSQEPSSPLSLVALSTGRIGFAFRLFLFLIRNRNDIDFVVLQGYGLAAMAGNLARHVTHVPTIMLVCSPHEEYYECRKSQLSSTRRFHGLGGLGLRWMGRINARIGESYVVLSEHLASVIRGHGAKQEISVCPVYGVNMNVFTPLDAPREGYRRRIGLPTTGSIIFFSSRIAPEKDVDTLLEAFSILIRDGRDVWLLNASGGHLDLVEKAISFNVRERLIARPAVDPRDELVSYYKAADLCVQASRAEGLGFSPLEALSCETPVVAAAVGGLRDTVLRCSAGWTYPPGDAGALASALAYALDDPEEARRRTRRGREMVAQTYEQEVTFTQFAAIAGQIIESHRT